MVGVLYIIGTAAGILSVATAGTILNKSNYMAEIAAHDNQVILGGLFVLIMALALAIIPALVFPILKKQNEALALGYVIFRGALETITALATVIIWLFLVALSKDAAANKPLSDALLTLTDRTAELTTIVFIGGALMFYTLLYQSRVVPRWLSGWGLIATAPYLASALLALFSVIEPELSAETLLFMPLAIQEMVLAIWLIVKGFNLSHLKEARA